jgi:hypothetical protein
MNDFPRGVTFGAKPTKYRYPLSINMDFIILNAFILKYNLLEGVIS